MAKKVVITGVGALTAIGNDINTTWDAIKMGQTGIDTISSWDVSHWEYQLAAEIKDYNPRKMVADRKLLKMISRHDVLGLNAAQQAIDHSAILEYRSHLEDASQFNDKTGVFIGSGGIKFNQQYDLFPLFTYAKGDMQRFADGLFEQIHPMWLLRILSNNVLAYVGIQNQFKGVNQNIVNHGVSGTQAIAEAANAIKNGQIERAVVVGYDYAFEPQGQIYYSGIGVLSKTGLKSFAKDRDGTILAEGAGALLLETYESAKARGATIYGEILADFTNSEAQGIFAVRNDGASIKTALEQTLAKANVNPDNVAMITAHANGTINSDATEALAIHQVFGSHTPVTGFKWSLGHTLSAAGVLETILTLLSLREKTAPGIATLTEKAHDCNMISISNDNQSLASDIGMVITRGFSGLNSCLLVRGMDDKSSVIPSNVEESQPCSITQRRVPSTALGMTNSKTNE